MKILDRYILTSYLKTFISVFVILMLIFVLQTIWLYIAELAGKDLDVAIIGKFLIYITPTLIPLILPLTILLASIMVFGNFAENYEFAAMKSTGISLQRAMRSLSVFIVLLGITTFFFSNNVIPWAQYNSYNLRKNIAKLKPAMVIAEGQFNQIGGLNIKVDEKSGDRGQFLKTVVIHKQNSSRPGNFTTIVSKTGELISSKESDVLQLVLHDGNYYDEIQSKDFKERQKKPFAKSEFKEYIINVDLTEINGDIDLEQKQITSKYNMLSVGDLDYTIDSLKIKKGANMKEFSQNTYARATVSGFKKDSLKMVKQTSDTKKDYLELFDTKQKVQIVDMALNKVLSTNQIIDAKERELGSQAKWLNKHIIVFHEKFALGFACIILFFVGAPLGALIKKGGLGLPMVVAIVLFLLYHFIGIFAKNSAEDGSLNPALSSWLSTLIMFPVSIYLTNRATKDRGLFDIDLLLQPITTLLKGKDHGESHDLIPLSSNDIILLNSYENKQLIDIIKNYKQYDYNESYRIKSLEILDERGIGEKQLRFSGNFINTNYENATKLVKDYTINSVVAMKLYTLYIIFNIAGPVLNNNGFPTIGKTMVILGILFTILFLIYLFRSLTNLNKFNRLINNNKGFNLMIVLVLVGIPFYFLLYIYFRKRVKEDLKGVR